MSHPNMIKAEDFGRGGAAFITAQLEKTNADIPSVILPTGKTPQAVYEVLRETGMPPFRFFGLDQYWGIEKDDPRSYAREMADNLLDPLSVPENMRITFDAMSENAQDECARMDNAIQNLPDGRIDLAVLGIGTNGHLGFNEPGTSFSIRTHLASLSEATRSANAPYCDPHGGVPEKAITLGLKTIFEARCIILLVRAGKEDVLDRALNGPVTENLPASLLQKHDNLHIVVDAHVAKHFGL